MEQNTDTSILFRFWYLEVQGNVNPIVRDFLIKALSRDYMGIMLGVCREYSQ